MSTLYTSMLMKGQIGHSSKKKKKKKGHYLIAHSWDFLLGPSPDAHLLFFFLLHNMAYSQWCHDIKNTKITLCIWTQSKEAKNFRAIHAAANSTKWSVEHGINPLLLNDNVMSQKKIIITIIKKKKNQYHVIYWWEMFVNIA